MSGYRDQVDNEFVKTLYPEYLLKQPIAYNLLANYYKNKKIFHTTNHNKLRRSSIIGNKLQDNRTYYSNPSATDDADQDNQLSSFYVNQLSPNTKREIWQKLMKLGVLGTVPYDSTSDEYIIQLYKYFYLGNQNVGSDSQPITVPNGADEGLSTAPSRNQSFHNIGNVPEIARNNSWNFSTSRCATSSRTASNGEFKRLRTENDDNDGMGDFLSIGPKDSPSRMKSNTNKVNIYDTLEYPLPTQWIPQPGDSVILSSDGVSRLSPNPHWKSYMKIESSENMTAYGRQRMRENATTPQPPRSEYASTWANKSVSQPNIGVYYYEVRVISVENANGDFNSNMLLGFKLLPFDLDLDDVDHPQGGASNHMSNALLDNAISSVRFMEMNRGARGRTDSSTNNDDVRPYVTEHANENEPMKNVAVEGLSAINDDKEKMAGFYGYSGFDGRISTPRHMADYNEPYTKNDVIGCGVNFIDGSVFYTKNGIFLGTAFRDIQGCDIIPAIALRPGNTVKTNFGIYEEFVYDIMGYQNKMKLKSYEHIFRSFSGDAIPFQINEEEASINESEDFPTDEIITSVDDDVVMNDYEEGDATKSDMNGDNQQANANYDKTALSFLINEDQRLVDGIFNKPDGEKINNLSTEDGSVSSTLNVLINDYLIHEGMIDVAKGFLNDLRKDTRNTSEGTGFESNVTSHNMEVIRHNEQQIISEENILKLRFEVRRLINAGDIEGCIACIKKETPGLLEGNIRLSYELKLVEFLHEIRNNSKNITELLQVAKNLSDQYINNIAVEVDLREKFRIELADVSGLFAYNNPAEEAPEDLALYLSNEFLQDRLFQMVNNNILKFLGKESECALDNIVRYTRSMISTLMKYEKPEPKEHLYYKILNLDEDLLNL